MARLELKGPVVSSDDSFLYDWFEIPCIDPKKISSNLKEIANDEEVILEINSGGGDFFAGGEIYTMLKQSGRSIIAEIHGMAASAASLIAMAAKEIRMSPISQLMIHRVSVSTNGNSDDLEGIIEALNEMDRGAALAYSIKTGKAINEIIKMMAKETWFGADKAIELGFADSVMFVEKKEKAEEEKIFLNAVANGMLPPAMKNKMIEIMAKEKELENEKRNALNKRFELLKR